MLMAPLSRTGKRAHHIPTTTVMFLGAISQWKLWFRQQSGSSVMVCEWRFSQDRAWGLDGSICIPDKGQDDPW